MQYIVLRNLQIGFFRQPLVALGFMLLAFTAAEHTMGATFEWAAPVDSRFEGGFSWSPVGVPDEDDIARFSVSSGPSYEVQLSLDHSIDKLVVDGGTPFLSGGAVLTITDDGGATDEDILVIGGGWLDIQNQIEVVAGDGILSVGNDGDGLLTVEGSGASLTVDGTSRGHFIGGRGALGQLVVSDSATANFGYNAGSEGTLEVGVSNFNATQGFVNVLGAGTLNVGNLNVATSTTNATGFVALQDNGSAVNVLADTSVGSASGGVGTLQVSSGAILNTEGLEVHSTGVVELTGGVTGGRLNAAGSVNIDGGSLTIGSSGVFDLAAGQTFSASNGGQVVFAGPNNIEPDTTFELNSGADLSAFNLNVAVSGGDGTLLVDGAGSTVTATGFTSLWGLLGDTADVTFRNQSMGAFGAIELADSNNGSTVANLLVETDADVTTGGLIIASHASAATGTITVNGAGSTLTQAGTSQLTLGSASGSGAATINVQNGGVFSTGTGTTTINDSGTVNVGSTSGTRFNANGPIDIDGGTLDVGLFAQFNLAAGQTLTASDAGQVTFGGTYAIEGGTTFEINSGADLSAIALSVGLFGGDGTLVVDGPGSTVTATGGISTWATSGDSADITFRNQAVGSFGETRLALSNASTSVGEVSVESGADLNLGSLFVATIGSGATGTITIDGSGSTLAQSGASLVTLGSSSGTGAATINVQNSGTFTTGTGTTTINATGSMNVGVGGGTFNVNGALNVNGGSFSAVGADAFNLATGQTLTASDDGQVDLSSGYDIDSGTTFEINSGADLTAGFLDIGNSGGDGTLVVDGVGSTVTAGSFSIWGNQGNTADVNFRNQAVASWGEIRLANSSTDATVGNLLVELDADVTADNIILATQDSGATGTITLDGPGTTLTQNGAATLTLGSTSGTGTATINIQNDGVFTTGTGTTTINKTGLINLDGGDFVADGQVVVDGGSVSEVSGGFNVFAGGITVRGGGSLVGVSIGSPQPILIEGSGTTFTGGSLGVVGPVTIRDEAAVSVPVAISGGVLTVSEDATLETHNTFSLGNSSTATMNITSGGVVTSNSADIALGTVSPGQGTVTITGADSAWIVENRIDLGGLSNSVEGDGRINVDSGGLLTVGAEILIQATSEIEIDGGHVIASEIDNTHGGTFDFNFGRVSVENFEGNLLNEGGTLAPGGSAGSTTILGDYTQQAGATLEIEIGGTAAVTEHDFVSVSGDVLLDGLLQLSLIDEFVPDASETFTVLSAGNLTGFFDNATPGARLDTTDGLGSFLVDIDFGLDQIVLSDFIPNLTADFDLDGDVDGADFLGIQRNNPALIPLWQTEYGTSAPAAVMAIPEPTASSLIFVALSLVAAKRGRMSYP